MLPLRCFTCGHVLAHIEIEYEEKVIDITNNIKLDEIQKVQAIKDLINILLPDRWKYRYCCRSRLLGYVDLIKIII